MVYILWFENFHGTDELIGIYSTKEGAEQRKNKQVWNEISSLRIEEYSLDSE